MASSPTEPRATERQLLAVAEAYEQALERLQCADLDNVKTNLNEVDRIHSSLRQAKRHDPVPEELLIRIETAHGSLCSLIGSALDQSKGSIQRSMDGRRALKGYGNRSAPAGRQHSSEI